MPNCANHEFHFMINSYMPLRDKSVTLMRFYGFPHHVDRSFTFASDDALLSVITQNGGRKRIFILFFCVVPPSQYPPSGFAGHLLINKEACPIPIFPVRIPFLNTAVNPSLALWMSPYRIPSFRAEVRMLYENEEKSQHDTERRIYYTDDALTSYTRIMESAVRRSCWRTQCDWGYSLVVMI